MITVKVTLDIDNVVEYKTGFELDRSTIEDNSVPTEVIQDKCKKLAERLEEIIIAELNLKEPHIGGKWPWE